MKLIYADPGLASEVGHHANSCRGFRKALAARGVPMTVLAYDRIAQPLAEELDVRRHFRAWTYWNTDGDPFCGWLNAFHVAAQQTAEDFADIPGMTRDDVLYVNSAQPAQLMGLASWLRTAGPERPHVVVEFGTDPGVRVTEGPGGRAIGPGDFRSVLWRFVAGAMSGDKLDRVDLTTFDAVSSAVYQALLGRPVGVLPLPQAAAADVTSRVGRRPVTISVLGHQRPEKGYHHVPEVMRLLLGQAPQSQLLVHNATPNDLPDAQRALRALAENEPRLQLDERVAGPDIWRELLAKSDLILCPYDPAPFASKYSAIASEAIASGIPAVVPAGTTLERVIVENGGAGATFTAYQPASIAEAVGEALDVFDDLADQAYHAAGRWQARMGVANTVDKIFQMSGV